MRIRFGMISKVVALAIVVSIASLGVFAAVAITKSAETKMSLRKESIARTSGLALAVVETGFPGARGEFTADGLVSKIIMKGPIDVGQHQVVDRIAQSLAGVATIVGRRDDGSYVRLSTTARREDGSRAIGVQVDRASPVVAALEARQPVVAPTRVGGIDYLTRWVPIVDPSGAVLGGIASGSSLASVQGSIADFNQTLTIIGIVAAIVSALAMWWVVRRQVSPLADLSAAAGKLAEGQIAVVIPHQALRDERGGLARSLEGLRNSLEERQRLEGQTAADRIREADRAKALGGIIESFRERIARTVSQVAARADQLDSTAASLAAGMGEARAQAGAASEAAAQSGTQAQTIAAAIVQLTATAEEIRRQASEMAGAYEKTAATVEGTVQEVQKLSDSANDVANVITLIGTIAEQTNLLALNATIEAARAGEAGKGFSVVASEVKALAAQTKRATEQISSKIIAIQDATNQTVQAINSIATATSGNVQATGIIRTSIDEQTAAFGEIAKAAATSVEGTAVTGRQVNEMLNRVDSTEETSRAIASVAGELAQDVVNTRAVVDEFLQRVQAA
ncbi:methyl-accepting chemotaxis protein [Phreatobacter oligotrophus]|uniref:methyl-accepting chemotaxis protein n=1 Tax=Phreatobacter oligotrophus TaxID=1122261 RepID=UPI00235268D1|nr:methyl-accepting chemotaxis protein [Phreatobacter oligotrophus]MBX9991716.1 Cache 3/Cache 2 fusion domain-containing protein [Phreatobacter oligotrophus]